MTTITKFFTSYRYTAVTFLPRNLFEQFMRIANFYFLILMCLAIIVFLSQLPFD